VRESSEGERSIRFTRRARSLHAVKLVTPDSRQSSATKAGGLALISIPNFSHWYPRLRVLSGTFDYDDQGILDRGHVRFFTRRSFERLIRGAGLHINRIEAIGTPMERLTPSQSQVICWLSRLDRFAAMVYPSLFAYQYLYELVPERVLEPKQLLASSRA
jgi:hypothetical protein